MSTFNSYNIKTKVHGNFLVHESKKNNPAPLLVGFHGYGETAKAQMQLLQKIPSIENWTVCSIQALHSFYNTRAKIGYSWMTSHDRELRINENVEYVNSVISEIKKNHPVNDTIVFHGFSQGTNMACRAALLGKFNSCGVILLAGDIPPEFENLKKVQRILLARGKKDKFYSSIRWKNDIKQVQESEVESYICEFNGGHGGHKDYFKAVDEFLNHYI